MSQCSHGQDTDAILDFPSFTFKKRFSDLVFSSTETRIVTGLLFSFIVLFPFVKFVLEPVNQALVLYFIWDSIPFTDDSDPSGPL